MASDDDRVQQSKLKEGSNGSRRNFLKTGLTLAVLLMAAGIASLAKSLVSPGAASQTKSAASPFPRVKVANASDLASGKPITFNYPLEETPDFLVKLGVKAQGGVGPDGDIVAFSQICQHLGCIYGYLESGASPSCDATYKAPGPVGYCCCHGSVFDLANGARVIGGPSPRPQPQVVLEFDSSTGDIYAVGMTPPAIFGHGTGSNDVLNDLQGGTLVK